MMPKSYQMIFPFESLDIQHRSVLTVDDIRKKLRVSVDHVINLVEAGELKNVNTAVSELKRKQYRIPIESYRDFIIRRMSGPARKEFLQSLPRDTLLKVYHQLKELLAA